MNSKVGLIKVKVLVKSVSNNAINFQALEIGPEINGDSMATLLSQPTLPNLSVTCCFSVCIQLGDC